MSMLAITAGAAATGLYFLKKYNTGGICTSKARLDGKIALITGANTGIGKETAKDLAKRGAHVYLACRSVERARCAADDILISTGVPQDKVSVIQVDLASLESIRHCAAQFMQKEKRLDILVNNAGFSVPHDDQTKTKDGFDSVFGVNHLGPFMLTNLLMERLVESAPSRIVNVASRAHIRTNMNWETTEHINSPTTYSGFYAYCQSKLANILFTKELATRLKETDVSVYALHPGVVRTAIFQSAHPFLGSAVVYNIISSLVWPFCKEPWAGAQTVIHCAVEENIRDESGSYFSDCRKTDTSEAAKSQADAKRLWDISTRLVGLTSSEIHPRLL